jgi:hypothetical protein
VLNLPHAFARQPQLFTYLFERQRLMTVQPETQPQDFRLARVNPVQ